MTAYPIPTIVERISAKSRLMSPGVTMISVMPCTVCRSTSSATLNASVMHVPRGTSESRRSLGTEMMVSTLVAKLTTPASATFFRSMGGAFGVALFGTIFATRLSHQLSVLPRAVTAHLGSGVQLDPTQIDQLPPKVHDVVLHAFAHALSGVFLFGMALSLVPFVLSWFLREKPLRTTVAREAEEEPLGPAGQFAWESPEG